MEKVVGGVGEELPGGGELEGTAVQLDQREAEPAFGVLEPSAGG